MSFFFFLAVVLDVGFKYLILNMPICEFYIQYNRDAHPAHCDLAGNKLFK